MVTRAQTRANYDRLSRWYDLLAGSSEQAFCELGLGMLDVRPGERVLEIGSGTGQTLLALARSAGPSGLAVGLDLSGGMCHVACGRLAQTGSSYSLAALVCGDAAGIPFRSEVFDAVFMSFTLELFGAADAATVLEGCRRVLRDRGRLCVVAMSATGPPSTMTRLYYWAHSRFPAWIDCRPIPLTAILARHSFHIGQVTAGSMWGLPVEVAIAGNCATTSG